MRSFFVIHMTLEVQTQVEYHASMFLFLFNNNFRLIKVDRWVNRFISLLKKDYPNSLFGHIRVKWHFPLVSPFNNNFEISI